MRNIDHQFTDEVVCPYCGYESKDSWKFGDSNMSEIGGLECVQCERGFLYTSNLRVTYSTSKSELLIRYQKQVNNENTK